MAVLPDGATFEDFTAYVLERREAVPLLELKELYERHVRLKSVSVHNGQGLRSILPVEQRGLTNKERDSKNFAEAKASGRNIEPLPAKATW
tara:strand:+ start:94 stop:366 length:273 start_codon:yes stop_codon:yes gene_type:complete